MTQAGFNKTNQPIIYMLFVVVLGLNIALWVSKRDVQGAWLNVPPVPSNNASSSFALGDSQFSYRMTGVMLQNLGDTGGRVTHLSDYNYETLSKWFWLMDKLDYRSGFMPFLAAYYYGAVDDPEKLSVIIEYLREVGQREGAERWRWLMHAIYMARWQIKDLDLALDLARDLAALDPATMPGWAAQMPAFILNAKGSKEEALDIMVQTLKSNVDNMHPNEINATKDYICTRILEPAQAKDYPLCLNEN